MITVRQSAYDRFAGSINSPYTKKGYESCLKKFIAFSKAGNYNGLLRLGKGKKLQEIILSFILKEKQRNIRAKTLGLYLTALWHFYQFNDVTNINWTVLRKYIGQHQKSVKDRAYTRDEIRAIMKHADPRMKFVTALLASTGMRIGAVPVLSCGDWEKVANLCKVTVYAGTPDEYVTYGTPECLMLGEEYLEYRKNAGERITPSSPLIRDKFDSENADAVANPQRLKYGTLMSVMRELLMDAGVRKAGNHDMHSRHAVMLNHGFRKFYNTQMLNAGVKPIIKEMLIGHKAIGLETSYYRPTEHEMMSEYLKAVDALTIFSDSKLKKEVQDLKKELASRPNLELLVQAQQQRIEKLEMLMSPEARELDEKFGYFEKLGGNFGAPKKSKE
jgi:integrase